MKLWPIGHVQPPDDTSLRVAALEREVARLKDSLRRADQRNTTLVHEVQCRVGHTLGILRLLTSRIARSGGSLEEMMRHFDGRLGVIARSQSHLLQNAVAGIQLHELVAEEMVAHAAHENEKVELSGPAVRLCSKTAGTISLAIHELVVNAVKFGALCHTNGRIRVEWSTEHGRGADGTLGEVLRLLWLETGVPVVQAPLRKGFGVELIERMLPGDIGAATSIVLGPDGVQCTIVLPIGREVELVATQAAGSDRS